MWCPPNGCPISAQSAHLSGALIFHIAICTLDVHFLIGVMYSRMLVHLLETFLRHLLAVIFSAATQFEWWPLFIRTHTSPVAPYLITTCSHKYVSLTFNTCYSLTYSSCGGVIFHYSLAFLDLPAVQKLKQSFFLHVHCGVMHTCSYFWPKNGGIHITFLPLTAWFKDLWV